ncbi:hypothetical protein JVU11DRAFT_10525 [Chiua virens]|nr:hypothetical protein JVU11DRAFT_10525 [Chiua virens]
MSQSQGGAAHASGGRVRHPSAKVQAMEAKKHEERVQKRDQVAKAAQHDPLKAPVVHAHEAISTDVPTMVDKAFGSRVVGGLGSSLTHANLATPTLVARKGNVPPPPVFPKPFENKKAPLPAHVRIHELAQQLPLKLDMLRLDPPKSDVNTHKRVHEPTPFPTSENV